MWKPFKSQFVSSEIRQVHASHMRNLGNSGSIGYAERMNEAVGSDTRSARKLSGSVQPRGMVYHKTTRQTVQRQPCSDKCSRHKHDERTR